MKNKIFRSRVYTPEKILEVVAFRNSNTLLDTHNKFHIKRDTINNWVKKYEEGYSFEKIVPKKSKYLVKKIKKNTNSKYSYEYKKNVITSYRKIGFRNTINKYEMSETTLIRWIKLNENKKLKPVATSYKKSVGKSDISRSSRRKNLEILSAFPLDLIVDKFSKLTTIGKYKVIEYMAETKLSTSTLCKMANVNRRSYYQWIQRGKPDTKKYDRDLANWIQNLDSRGLGYLGYRRIKEYYQDETGVVVSENKIKRIMKIINYQAKSKYNAHKNNSSDNILHNRKNIYKNKLIKNIIKQEGLSAEKPNFIWAVDGKQLFKRSDLRGRLDIIAIIDTFDKSILNYAYTDGSKHTYIYRELLKDTILKNGKPLIVHSDNGPEYVNLSTIKWMKSMRIVPSFIEPHTPKQNGIIERWNGSIGNEINFSKIKTIKEAMRITDAWIYDYNNRRRHSALKMSSDDPRASKIGNKKSSNQTPSKYRKIGMDLKYSQDYLKALSAILMFDIDDDK